MAKHPTRLEAIGNELLHHPQGVSEREMVLSLNITSGRNEINEIEGMLGFKFNREWERIKANGGIGKYYRYSIKDKAQAKKLVDFVNGKRTARGAEPLSQAESAAMLAKFSEGEQ